MQKKKPVGYSYHFLYNTFDSVIHVLSKHDPRGEN